MKIKLEPKHYQWGLTAFLVIICSVIAVFIIYGFGTIRTAVGEILSVMSPFIYGLVMAYLLGPIYNGTVRGTYRALNSSSKYRLRNSLALAKAVGTIVSIIIIIVVVGGVIWMIIPGLIDSIVKAVEMIPDGIDRFVEWVNIRFAKYPTVMKTIDSYTDSIMDYARQNILPRTGTMAAEFSSRIINAVSTVVDFIIGIIICAYFLNLKDTLAAQSKKVLFAFFKEKKADEILEGARYTNKVFGGFISGKILDSAIIGVICFICMSIFGWEYTLLISCIIGITNIIPFFGPFIGAIPSALLLLIANPVHAVYFIIFIFILQQFDGNILGPKILGDTTGLESFWVLFSILVGGGLFGFIGMILGVPVFAVIYAYCSRSLNRRLKKKGFSVDTGDYKVDKYRTRPGKGAKSRFTFINFFKRRKRKAKVNKTGKPGTGTPVKSPAGFENPPSGDKAENNISGEDHAGNEAKENTVSQAGKPMTKSNDEIK